MKIRLWYFFCAIILTGCETQEVGIVLQGVWDANEESIAFILERREEYVDLSLHRVISSELRVTKDRTASGSELLATFEGEMGYSVLEYSQAHNLAVVKQTTKLGPGTYDVELKLLDIITGQISILAVEFVHRSAEAVSLSPDGKWVAIVSAESAEPDSFQSNVLTTTFYNTRDLSSVKKVFSNSLVRQDSEKIYPERLATHWQSDTEFWVAHSRGFDIFSTEEHHRHGSFSECIDLKNQSAEVNSSGLEIVYVYANRYELNFELSVPIKYCPYINVSE